MQPGSEPTPWELDRRFDRLDRSIHDGFRRMDERLDKMVTSDVFSIHQQNNEARFSAMHSDLTAVDQRHKSNRDHLKGELDRLEESRAADRRMMIKAAVAAMVAFALAVFKFILDALNGTGAI